MLCRCSERMRLIHQSPDSFNDFIYECPVCLRQCQGIEPTGGFRWTEPVKESCMHGKDNKIKVSELTEYKGPGDTDSVGVSRKKYLLTKLEESQASIDGTRGIIYWETALISDDEEPGLSRQSLRIIDGCLRDKGWAIHGLRSIIAENPLGLTGPVYWEIIIEIKALNTWF